MASMSLLAKVRIAKAQRAANVGRCVDCVTEGITTERKLAIKRDGTLEPGPRCVTTSGLKRSPQPSLP